MSAKRVTVLSCDGLNMKADKHAETCPLRMPGATNLTAARTRAARQGWKTTQGSYDYSPECWAELHPGGAS